MGEDKNITWYRLKEVHRLFVHEGGEKSLYRFIPFDILLQLLNESKLVLMPTITWEDTYENFLLHETFYDDSGRQVPIHKLADRFYGQCWTSRMSSDAMWRIYSPDTKSVRIRTSLRKLYDIIPKGDKNGSFLLRKVDYYPQSKIENDLAALGSLNREQLALLMLQSQFVKRNSFSHESEYRLVYFSDGDFPKNNSFKHVDIDPIVFVERICFDPRADDRYVDRCTKILSDRFGYPTSRIHKSSLYSFHSLSIDLTK